LRLDSVRIGEWKISTDQDCDEYGSCAPAVIDNKIISKVVHTNYNRESVDQHYDIALLRLEKTVEFNDYVKPLCLPLNRDLWDKNYYKHTFEVAGQYQISTTKYLNLFLHNFFRLGYSIFSFFF
jgi:hypothetical protein